MSLFVLIHLSNMSTLLLCIAITATPLPSFIYLLRRKLFSILNIFFPETYVEADEVALGVIDSVKSMLVQMLPRMSLEGRPILTVAFGCTGGKHRSVWATETVGKWLRDEGYSVKVAHREIDAGS